MTDSSRAHRPAMKSGDPYCPDLHDLIFVDFSPQAGTEQAYARPALVLTPRAYNSVTGRCFACPITSRVKGYPYEVALPPDLKTRGVVIADQGKALSWSARGARFVETAPEAVTDEVKAKLKAFLQIV